MADDWASRFMPSTEGESKEDNALDGEDIVQDDTIRLSDQVLMSALDILRNDVQTGDAEIKEFILSVVEVLGHLGSRLDEIEGLLVRKFGQMEATLLQPPPEPMTNVFDEFPELVEEIRQEAEGDADMPELPETPGEPLCDDGIELKDYLAQEVTDAYEDWKNPDSDGSWQKFVKVCGGPVKAKECREIIEDSLPSGDGNTSP